MSFRHFSLKMWTLGPVIFQLKVIMLPWSARRGMRSIDCVFEKTKQAYVNVISTSNPISTSVFQIILFLISDFIIF